MDNVIWEVTSEETEYVLDDDPNVHLKNAELALCEKRYDDAETHAAYAESVSKEKSKSVQKQVKQQCDIVMGFVYVDKAKDLINGKRYTDAEKYVELACSLSHQDKKLLEKCKHIVGWLNTSLAEEAKAAFEQGHYDVAEKYIDRISITARAAGIRDNGNTFVDTVSQLVAVNMKRARTALNKREYESVRIYVNHARLIVSRNHNAANGGFGFSTALAALINEYLNEARISLKNGDYENVIAHIGYAQSIAENCAEAVRKCDDMIYALADNCLDKARDNLAELRFDNISVYIGYAQSIANEKGRIIQDCTAIQAYTNLEKSKIALNEKQYDTALTSIRFAENMIDRSGAAAEDIRRVCDALLKKLVMAYAEEVKTALQEDRYTEAKEYAESARLIVNRNATVMQECKKLLIELHFELAKAAMQKKLYTAVDTAIEYVQFISEKSDNVRQQCEIIRSSAFLGRAKDAFSEADYEQAVRFMEKAKSVSADDANIGKQCMKILRRLKKKGYAKDVPWDVDRLRNEMIIRRAKYTLRIIYAVGLSAIFWGIVATLLQNYFNPFIRRILECTLASGYLIGIVLIKDSPKTNIFLYTLYHSLAFCCWPALSYIVSTNYYGEAAAELVVPAMALFSVIDFLLMAKRGLGWACTEFSNGIHTYILDNSQLIKRCLYIGEQVIVFFLVEYCFSLFLNQHLTAETMLLLEICLILHTIIVLMYGQFRDSKVLVISPVCLCVPPLTAGALWAFGAACVWLGNWIGTSSVENSISLYTPWVWMLGGVAYVFCGLLSKSDSGI